MRGIPDLRTGEDLYLSTEEDWAFARKLDARFDEVDFRGLLNFYYELASGLRADQKERQIGHILTAAGRARAWIKILGKVPDGPILDLGCGSGSFLAVFQGEGIESAGVDIAMRWLIVARKRLDEEGLREVPLACASAEGLPLADGSIAGVVAGDVIEHVGDQGATLAEAYRVLKTGGRLVMASPNRYSLAPEPHVGAWGVGFLPRAWMPLYVRWTRGVDFRGIHTLGYAEWTRLLRVSPFNGGTIRVPALPVEDLAQFGRVKRMLARCYQGAVATSIGRMLAKRFGPFFHVVCEQGETQAPLESSRAIRRRSRRSAERA